MNTIHRLLCLLFFFCLGEACKDSDPKLPENKESSLLSHPKILARVQNQKTNKGFTVQSFLALFLKQTNEILLKKGKETFSTPQWEAQCSQSLCQVKMETWAGKEKLTAWWLVQKDKVSPQNTLAKKLMQR